MALSAQHGVEEGRVEGRKVNEGTGGGVREATVRRGVHEVLELVIVFLVVGKQKSQVITGG